MYICIQSSFPTMKRSLVARSTFTSWKGLLRHAWRDNAVATHRRVSSQLTKQKRETRTQRRRLVLLGTGWGGYSVLRNVNKKLFDVIVVSPRNHFLFTPLLASTTVGTLEFRSIIEPVRNTGFRDQHHFHLSRAVGLDKERRTVNCVSVLDSSLQYQVPYDILVICVGAEPNTFGIPGVKKHAYFLKVFVLPITMIPFVLLYSGQSFACSISKQSTIVEGEVPIPYFCTHSYPCVTV